MKKTVLIFASLIISFLIFCIGSSAFDANDYDYGGGYNDYSYGGYDSYDNDYSYGGGYSSKYDDDDDYYYSGSSGDSEMTWEEMLIMIAVVAGMLTAGGIWATMPSKKSKKTQSVPKSKQVTVPNRTVDIRNAVQQFDPSFDSEQMLTFARQTFIAVQNAWCAKDLEPVRGIMHNNLYNTTNKQVQAKIEQQVTYHYENYKFNSVYLTSYVRDSEYEYITVYLNTEYIDYQTDDRTGKIFKGDKTTMWKMRYLMKFMRSVNGGSEAPKFCPNCGAPLDISSSGKCEYCGSTVTTGSFDWLLSDFTTVRNDTKDDGIRI